MGLGAVSPFLPDLVSTNALRGSPVYCGSLPADVRVGGRGPLALRIFLTCTQSTHSHHSSMSLPQIISLDDPSLFVEGAYIAGARIRPREEKQFKVFDPAHQRLIGECPECSVEDLDDAIDAAVEAPRTGKPSPLAKEVVCCARPALVCFTPICGGRTSTELR
jgi:hypothetical protein